MYDVYTQGMPWYLSLIMNAFGDSFVLRKQRPGVTLHTISSVLREQRHGDF